MDKATDIRTQKEPLDSFNMEAHNINMYEPSASRDHKIKECFNLTNKKRLDLSQSTRFDQFYSGLVKLIDPTEINGEKIKIESTNNGEKRKIESANSANENIESKQDQNFQIGIDLLKSQQKIAALYPDKKWIQMKDLKSLYCIVGKFNETNKNFNDEEIFASDDNQSQEYKKKQIKLAKSIKRYDNISDLEIYEASYNDFLNREKNFNEEFQQFLDSLNKDIKKQKEWYKNQNQGRGNNN